ncbi:receptor-interacting serine/threonine-protein kinase 4-like [Haliotis rubra]|uniref:receptor-interacting serine/threonine-protein kinase 4-like n=1 Tax=Haliotis rubra TaxID=36100 RepID=UPI001EE4EE1A|nr:receptor-interacting serine/threonine-protein kinase 4-like [Haliotis rubra]
MEKGIPVPDRLSQDFHKELLDNVDEFYHLYSILHIAGNKTDILEYIAKEGPGMVYRFNRLCYYKESHFIEDIPDYPLSWAAAGGDVDIVKALIKAGFNPHITNKEENTQKDFRIPLVRAVEKGHLPIVRLLVEEHGCDVNVSDGYFKRTALHRAAQNGDFTMVKYLVEHEADVNAVDSVNGVPLYHTLDDHKMVKYLIANGAKVKTWGRHNLPLLSYAADCCDDLDVFRTLIEAGAHVNHGGPPTTPFNSAAERGRLALMKLLYEYGADADLQDMYGITALHVVGKHTDTVCARYLIMDLNVSLDKTDGFDRTPFSVGVKCEHPQFLHLLMDAGYRPTGKDNDYIHHKSLTTTDLLLQAALHRAQAMTTSPCSLQDRCCFKIRRMAGRDVQSKVEQLNLPVVMKDMIKLNHLKTDLIDEI